MHGSVNLHVTAIDGVNHPGGPEEQPGVIRSYPDLTQSSCKLPLIVHLYGEQSIKWTEGTCVLESSMYDISNREHGPVRGSHKFVSEKLTKKKQRELHKFRFHEIEVCLTLQRDFICSLIE